MSPISTAPSLVSWNPRVQVTRVLVCLIFCTKEAVAVATPERWPAKLSAVRSAASTARAGPATLISFVLAATAAPEGQRSAFANPVLVGAVTVLTAIIAVFLAYNANQGLPFVPTRQLKVDIADGSQLVAGNDVREGGFRIGLVSELKPVELSSGQVGAELTLQLDKSRGIASYEQIAELGEEVGIDRERRRVAVLVLAIANRHGR